MATNSTTMKLLCLAAIVATMAVVAPQAAQALSCGDVSGSLGPCIGYLRTGGAVPPACCKGIKSLNSAASTPADRQSACRCLKTAAGSISGIDLGLAAGLPGKCGVSVPYKISPSTNCDSVQ